MSQFMRLAPFPTVFQEEGRQEFLPLPKQKRRPTNRVGRRGMIISLFSFTWRSLVACLPLKMLSDTIFAHCLGQVSNPEVSSLAYHLAALCASLGPHSAAPAFRNPTQRRRLIILRCCCWLLCYSKRRDEQNTRSKHNRSRLRNLNEYPWQSQEPTCTFLPSPSLFRTHCRSKTKSLFALFHSLRVPGGTILSTAAPPFTVDVAAGTPGIQ